MLKRKLVLSMFLALGTVGIATIPLPSTAATTVIRLETAPPAERMERVPNARRGYVWSPGFWDWRANRHAWVRGSWVRERHGYAYSPNRWQERDGRWVLERGRWDRDGDGIPNRRDAHPNNPNRG